MTRLTILIFLSLTVPLGILFGFHQYYIAKHSNLSAIKDWSEDSLKTFGRDFLSSVGYVKQGAPLHFSQMLNDPTDEIKETIGVFGGSVVHGDESSLNHNLTNYLQQLDPTRRYIDFSNPGYEFNQSYKTFDQYFQRFNIDRVYIGPASFNYHNYQHFQYKGDRSHIFFSRYILAGEGIKEVKLKGLSRQDIAFGYYAVFPQDKVLRFDSNAPYVFRMFYGLDSFLKNPFYYYKGDLIGEKFKIRSRMLNLISERVKSVSVFNIENIESLFFEDISKESNIRFRTLNYLEYFPYHMISHPGPNGNYDLAKQILSIPNKVYSFRLSSPIVSIPTSGGFEKLPLLSNLSGKKIGDLRNYEKSKISPTFFGILPERSNKILDALFLVGDPLKSSFLEKNGSRTPISEDHIKVICGIKYVFLDKDTHSVSQGGGQKITLEADGDYFRTPSHHRVFKFLPPPDQLLHLSAGKKVFMNYMDQRCELGEWEFMS